MITLKGTERIARGGEREVYAHPNNSGLLLKVLVEDGETGRGGPARAFFSRHFAGYRKRLLQREYEEYLRLSLCHLDRTTPLPIAHMFGFVATDLGQACLTESVRMPDGTLGRSWRSIAGAGQVTSRDVAALQAMGRDLLALCVRCSDLTASNVVLGHRTFADGQGDYEAVLVDGFGDTHAVPVRTWSQAANRFAIHKRMERMGRAAGVTWDRATMSYAQDLS